MVDDGRLQPIWGDRLYRIVLTARERSVRGSHRIVVAARARADACYASAAALPARRSARAPRGRTQEDSMERRAFLAATTAAAVTSADALAGAAGATAEPGTAARPQVLELRRYRLRNGALATRFAAYAKDALVPALGRAGLSPIGAWNVTLGPDSPTLHLLLPHPDAASVVTLDARLEADGEYRKAAASTWSCRRSTRRS